LPAVAILSQGPEFFKIRIPGSGQRKGPGYVSRRGENFRRAERLTRAKRSDRFFAQAEAHQPAALKSEPARHPRPAAATRSPAPGYHK